MQFRIGYRPAFLLHPLGAERGIALQNLVVCLALPDVGRCTRVGRRLLRRDATAESEHQRGGEDPRDLPWHHPLLFASVALRIMAGDRGSLNPPWSIRR